MILILGAGLAGLSLAYHLGDAPYMILEKEQEPGGLCRSMKLDGFTFDCTGHLLHWRNPYTLSLLEELLPDGWIGHRRRAAIYLYGRFIPYPFQANLWALPRGVREDCIKGYKDRGGTGDDFLSWIEAHFGKGMAEHFFIPYNRKLWRIPLEEISPEWAERFIPKPSPEEVLRGQGNTSQQQLGYHRSFLYPKEGGIGALAEALAQRVKGLQLGRAISSIRPKDRVVVLEDGEELPYQLLVSTLPLPELLEMMEGLPEEVLEGAKGLRYVSVFVIGMAVDRPEVSPYHWIYFPEARFPFYRVGFPSSLSPKMAPQGKSSLCVEVSHRPDEPLNQQALIDQTLQGLSEAGIIQEGDRVRVLLTLDIRYAYVIYDKGRRALLPQVLQFLEGYGIRCLGRYGLWQYATMEDVLLEGRDLATELR